MYKTTLDHFTSHWTHTYKQLIILASCLDCILNLMTNSLQSLIEVHVFRRLTVRVLKYLFVVVLLVTFDCVYWEFAVERKILLLIIFRMSIFDIIIRFLLKSDLLCSYEIFNSIFILNLIAGQNKQTNIQQHLCWSEMDRIPQIKNYI